MEQMETDEFKEQEEKTAEEEKKATEEDSLEMTGKITNAARAVTGTLFERACVCSYIYVLPEKFLSN